ncbi:MAG: glycosyltransferase family 4 protein [Candidatus Omnitrophica bacterium]|nr:glycosyltransferase family 4 protein [Candidatus Omnitrophota bacterium]
MKNILFTGHHAELGGGEISLLEIVKNLDKNNFNPLVCLGDKGPLEYEFEKIGVDVIILKLPGFLRKLNRDPGSSNKISAFIKSTACLPVLTKRFKGIIIEKNIDVVYINSIKSALYAAIAAKNTKRRIVWQLHDCLTKEFYPTWIIKLVIMLTHMADQIVCVSDIARQYFIKSGGAATKAVVIYNGIDIKKFNPGVNNGLKEQLGLSGKKIVSIVGRLEPWKGQEVFINAAGIICGKRDDVSFLIVGGALFGFDAYEEKLKKITGSLKLKNKVLFLGFKNDVERIYAASDIITHCSNRPEPFGRDIIEAMACAKPVISTAMGAVNEIINNGIDGVIIKPDSPEDLASAIIRLIDNTQAMAVIGKNAAEKARRLFDIKNLVKSTERLL